MSQFANTDDAGFQAFCQQLNQWVMQISENESKNVPGAHARQYGDNSEQYNLLGNGTQYITGGNCFKSSGNQTFRYV
jgi:hypothetical protein